MNNKILGLFVVLSLVIFSSSTYAQDNASGITKLSKGADLIFTGKVVKQNSTWNEDKTRIFTNVTITVDNYLKGYEGNTIIITHPGGEIGDVGELYTHVPTFTDKEEVLLFVKKDSQSKYYEVFQGESGKMTILEDKVTGEKKTVQNRKVTTLKNEIKNSL